MEPLSVFIASTKEQIATAEWVTTHISKMFRGRIDPKPWYAGWFSGQMTFDKIRQIAEGTDAAIFFWTPDDSTESRGSTRATARDNLIYEVGLFVGLHGPERTQILIPEDDQGFATSHPSDFHGMTFQGYPPFHDFVNMESLLASPIRRVCDYLLSLPRQPRPMKTFSQVTHRIGLESVHTLVGKEPLLEDQWLLPLLGRAREIDLVNAYRINDDLVRGLRDFATRPDARLRVCFMDAWDLPLVTIHSRKVGHDAEYMQRAVNHSLSKLFQMPESPDFGHPSLPDGCPTGLRAHYQVYLARQRITYSYCRIDNQALIVPLDVKTDKEPRPPAWAISRELSPATFDYYLCDIEKMFGDSTLEPLRYDSRTP